jgi:hypothetical protein
MPILERTCSPSSAPVLIVKRQVLESLERGRRQTLGLFELFLLGGLTLVGFLISYIPSSAGTTDDPVLSHFGGVLIAGITGLLVWFMGFRIRADARVLTAFTFLFIYAIACSVTEPERVRFMAAPFAFLLLSAVFFACYLGSRRGEPDKVCTTFWVAFAVISLAVAIIVQLTGGVHVLGINIEPQILRWAGWFGNPNRFGPTLAIGVLAAFSLAARSRTRSGAAFMGMVGGLLIAGVVSSGSRATLLALATGLSILVWSQTRHTATKILMIAVAVLVVVLAVLLTPQEVFEVYARKSSDEQRIGFVRQSLEMFSSGSPTEIIFGRGYGEFQMVTGRSTHNGYMRLIVEFGLVFTLGMMAFFALLLARARAARSEKFQAFVLATLGFLLVREVGAPALLSMRMEGLAFAFVIGALAAQPRRVMNFRVVRATTK